jgi:histone acetyltransferase (RNA polymerase elongator complex component)
VILPVFLPHLGCGNRCIYCNQSHITEIPEPGDLPSRLVKLFDKIQTPMEVALYSGNPLGLTPESLDELLHMFGPFSNQITGFRMSARPAKNMERFIPILKAHRVHTIELGIPTFNDQVLAFLGRNHTSADAVSAYELLASEGFRMGIQLMVGLPGESSGDLAVNLGLVEKLKPSTVRVYPLMVLTGTPLHDLFATGAFVPDSLETAVFKTSFAFARCWRQGIQVIKMGLTGNDVLDTAIVAGPFHPSFGYLVKSEVFRLAIEETCRDTAIIGTIKVRLSKNDIPHLLGFRRSNVAKLERRGLFAHWEADERLPVGHFYIEAKQSRQIRADIASSLSAFPF